MRLIRPVHDACDDAREAISRRLDTELPELDTVRLVAHLDGCAACRAFAAESSAVTGLLRSAPSERPSFDVAVPRRRHVSVRMLQAGAAAVAVAAVAGLSTVHGLAQRESAGPTVGANLAVGHDDELVPVRHPAAVRAHFRTAL